jgi:hypothetical protein
MTIVATIDDIYFGLTLMRSNMAYGCMLTSVSIAAAEGRLPGRTRPPPRGTGSRLQSDDGTGHGTFARRGERAAFSPAHPLNLLWQSWRNCVRPRPMSGAVSRTGSSGLETSLQQQRGYSAYGLPEAISSANALMLRTGGYSGCQISGACTVCRPLAKLYQQAKAPLVSYCQHGRRQP